MSNRFMSCQIEEVAVGTPLPVDLYLYLHHKFVVFRPRGDLIDRSTYERLEMQKAKTLFIQEKDFPKFKDWGMTFETIRESPIPGELFQKFDILRKDAHRKMLDIFSASHSDPLIAQAIESSKKLTFEVMKFPFAEKTLSQLQLYSQGAVNHSVNVSILSVYLANQMGYSHATTLQYLCTGGLLHDIGKAQLEINESDTEETVEAKLEHHPRVGIAILDRQQDVPMEVKTIVGQHHEQNDGGGYPMGLRGNAIHDLTKMVSIANAFDGFMGESSESLPVRQRAAVKQLENSFYNHFDPFKLERALKILRLGI